MILVTVGTHYKGFDRLVRAADELAQELEEQVVIQYGSSIYVPQNAKSFSYCSAEEMETLYNEARVVISHAAVGALILAIKMHKPLVIVPRRKDNHEVFDDHQVQLAKVLIKENILIGVMEPSSITLKQAITKAGIIQDIPTRLPTLVKALQDQLHRWAKK